MLSKYKRTAIHNSVQTFLNTKFAVFKTFPAGRENMHVGQRGLCAFFLAFFVYRTDFKYNGGPGLILTFGLFGNIM